MLLIPCPCHREVLLTLDADCRRCSQADACLIGIAGRAVSDQAAADRVVKIFDRRLDVLDPGRQEHGPRRDRPLLQA